MEYSKKVYGFLATNLGAIVLGAVLYAAARYVMYECASYMILGYGGILLAALGLASILVKRVI